MEWWEQQRKDFCLFFQHQADQSTFWRSQRKAARKKLEGKERVVTGVVFERTGKFLWALEGFPGGSVVKNPPANAGDTGHMGSIPGLGRSPGGKNGYPLQYSCLEYPMDRGAWKATVHGVTMGLTWLKWLGTHALTIVTQFLCLDKNCFQLSVILKKEHDEHTAFISPGI